MKEIIIISILLFMSGATVVCNLNTLSYITIFFIFFPIHIPFMGRDAITTGTVCVLFLYIKYLMGCMNERSFIKEKYDYIIYMLIFLVGASVILAHYSGSVEQDQIGRAIRNLVNMIGGLLVFLVIKNSGELQRNSESEPGIAHAQKLINLVLIFLTIHILISISVKFFPSLGSLFKIFISRDRETMDIAFRNGIERITSFVIGYEAYGEIIAMLTPFLIYNLFSFKNRIWFICLVFFCLGQVFAVTRAGILLFLPSMTLSLLYYSRQKAIKGLALAYTLSGILFIGLLAEPTVLESVIERFELSATAYKDGERMIDIINRGEVLRYGWDITTSNISLLGNGPIRLKMNFHNLYLTTVFQFGIAGAIAFFYVLLYPGIRLIKSLKGEKLGNKPLIFSCLLSFSIFLINEMKYEFTRGASYQQICWTTLAIYYLISRTGEEKGESKTIHCKPG